MHPNLLLSLAKRVVNSFRISCSSFSCPLMPVLVINSCQPISPSLFVPLISSVVDAIIFTFGVSVPHIVFLGIEIVDFVSFNTVIGNLFLYCDRVMLVSIVTPGIIVCDGFKQMSEVLMLLCVLSPTFP